GRGGGGGVGRGGGPGGGPPGGQDGRGPCSGWAAQQGSQALPAQGGAQAGQPGGTLLGRVEEQDRQHGSVAKGSAGSPLATRAAGGRGDGLRQGPGPERARRAG